ncbi:hypothetical protein [Geomobilimonas luticola]|uniref:Uncharacterized protein n=1 Tax=Geomobilimonas luticola TaxID=1114878 RepID=A0ABS5SCH0_9BACT|nr:hypothetical protein [Geomobilimonas luticola]MBT0653059.1 hypothetical protein [Geomobilimonas luticola]
MFRRLCLVTLLLLLFSSVTDALASSERPRIPGTGRRSSEQSTAKMSCTDILGSWKNDSSMRDFLATHDCSCPNAERPPVCPEKGKSVAGEKSYNFYWKIDFTTTSGKHYITDGTYVGIHSTYEEAVKACTDDAKRVTEMGDSILSLTCTPQ